MQRTPNSCPGCSHHLAISWDMWGQFYACQECGFTAEDDDELAPNDLGFQSRQADRGDGGPMRRPTEATLRLDERRAEIQDNLSAIIDDELPPELRERVQALLSDLAGNDLSMALLDLAQLYRSLTIAMPEGDRGQQALAAPDAARKIQTLIYAEDGKTITEQCYGPDRAGRCPMASLECTVACAGRWIMAAGWRFRVAPDAESCPVAALGVTRPQPSQITMPKRLEMAEALLDKV